MNDIIEVPSNERERTLRTIGHVSYLLHAIVAIGAVVPGVQASVVLLLVAFGIDLFKKDEAAGTWQESHFRWRIRSVLWAGGFYLLTAPPRSEPMFFSFLVPKTSTTIRSTISQCQTLKEPMCYSYEGNVDFRSSPWPRGAGRP